MDPHGSLYEANYSKFPFTYSQYYFEPSLILPTPPLPPPRVIVTNTATRPSTSKAAENRPKIVVQPQRLQKHVSLNPELVSVYPSRRRPSSSTSASSTKIKQASSSEQRGASSSPAPNSRKQSSLLTNTKEGQARYKQGTGGTTSASTVEPTFPKTRSKNAKEEKPNINELSFQQSDVLAQDPPQPIISSSFTQKLKNFFSMKNGKKSSSKPRKSTESVKVDTDSSPRKAIKKKKRRDSRELLLEQHEKAVANNDPKKAIEIMAKLGKKNEKAAKKLQQKQRKEEKEGKQEEMKLKKKEEKLEKEAKKLAKNPKAAAKAKIKLAKKAQKKAEDEEKSVGKAKKTRRASTAGKKIKAKDKKGKKKKKNGKNAPVTAGAADEEAKPEDLASWIYPLLTQHELAQLRLANAELFAFCLPEQQNREPSEELLEQIAQVQAERREEQRKLAEEEAELAAAAGEGDVEAQNNDDNPKSDEEKPPDDEPDLLADWRQSQQIELENNVAVQKELVVAVKGVPWGLYRKLKLLRLAKGYVEQNEGQLSRGSAAAEDFARRWKLLKRLIANLLAFLVPWNSRIKEVESRFGSFVSGYFVFTRWLFWLNLFLILVTLGCVVLPEYIVTRVRGRLPDGRWEDNALEIRKEDKSNLTLQDLLSFSGPILISPFYYGYYSQAEDWLANYNIPLSYFCVYMLLLAFSFYLILQRMAQNTKNERASDSSEQYVFSWRMFVSWDYLIANGDSADNKIAAIQTSFKEAISEVVQLEKKMNFWVKWARRMLAHLLWIGVLVLVVYSQQLAATVGRNAEARERNGGQPVQIYERYLNNLLTMFWPAAGPAIFENIQRVDAYHPRTQAQVTLFRLVGLVGINVYGFVSAGLTKIGIAAGNNTRLVPFLGAVFKRNATRFGEDGHIPSSLLPRFEPIVTTTIDPLEYVFQKDKPASEQTSAKEAGKDESPQSENTEGNVKAEKVFKERRERAVEESGAGKTSKEAGTSETLAEKGEKIEHGSQKESKTEDEKSNGEVEGKQVSKEEEERMKKEEEEELNELCKDCRLPEYVENVLALRELCWENEFGKELLEQVYLDSLKTVALSVFTSLGRAIFVRFAHSCWCWDLESSFPGYGEFKTGEDILEHIQVQFFVWIGAFFAPGVLLIGVVRLLLLMYFKSWLCNVSNIPSESVFRAGSANFYYIILLSALFIVTLIMGWLVVIVPPSFHCGPFSEYSRIYEILADRLTRAVQHDIIGVNGTVVATTKAPPRERNATNEKPEVIGVERIYEYITGPGFIIPIIVLLMLAIWYLLSSRGVLDRVNRDLKRELEVERTEGKRKVFAIAGGPKPPQGGMAALQATTAHDERRRSFAQVFRDVVPTEPSHATANLDELFAPSNNAISQTSSAHRKSLLVGGLFSFETAARKPLSSADVKTVAQQIIDIFGTIELDEPEASNELAKEEEEAAEAKAKRRLSKEKAHDKKKKRSNKKDKTLATIHEEDETKDGATGKKSDTDRRAKKTRKDDKHRKTKEARPIVDKQPGRRKKERGRESTPFSVTVEDEKGRKSEVI